MADRNDGGSAFPYPEDRDLYNVRVLAGSGGMTLRDYIAIDVLNGMICSAPTTMDRTEVNKAVWAAFAYDWADAMLKERTK